MAYGHLLAFAFVMGIATCQQCWNSDPIIRQQENILGNSMNYISTRAQDRVDIMFLLDQSGSLNAADFEIQLDFVKSVVEHFAISPRYSQVGIVTFSSEVQDRISLLHDRDKCTFLSDFKRIHAITAGATNMYGALLKAQQLFSQSGRTNTLKLVFLLSDGMWNVGGDPSSIAKALKSDKANPKYLVTVGVGRWDKTIMKNMASKDAKGRIMSLDVDCFKNFAALANYFHDGQQRAARVDATPDKCPVRCIGEARCGCDAYGGKAYSCICDSGKRIVDIAIGQQSCQACTKGKYSPILSTEKSCKLCPVHSTTTGVGSVHLADCQCVDGYSNVRDPGSRTPPCAPIKCGQVNPPQNAEIVGHDTCPSSFKSTCTFKCKQGYTSSGKIMAIQCQSNGQWNGPPSICNPIRCPKLDAAPSGGERWQCSNPLGLATDQFGAQCKSSCKAGFQPEGMAARTCQKDGTWSGGKFACEPRLCKGLTNPLHGNYHIKSCNQDAPFGTRCQVVCNPGYTRQGPAYRICGPEETWSEQDKPIQCIDTQEPQFLINCPSTLVITHADEQNSFATGVHTEWAEPSAKDNSGKMPIKKIFIDDQEMDPSSHEYPVGETTIKYTFTDESGNVAACDFRLRVDDIEPPRVDKCPSTIEKTSAVLITQVKWPEPSFSDNVGVTELHQTRRPNTDFTYGLHTVRYTAKDAAGNSAFCKFDVIVQPYPCPTLRTPANGAKKCDNVLLGISCTISCVSPNETIPLEFTVKPGFKVPDHYFCGSKGKWYPDYVPDCTTVRKEGIRILTDLNYVIGYCPDEATQQLLKENAADIFTKSNFGRASGVTVTADSFDVTCGEVNSTGLISGRRKRRTAGSELGVTVNIVDGADKVDQNELLVSLSSALQEASKKLRLQITGDSTAVNKGVGCVKGEEALEGKCYACPAGSVFNRGTKHCIKCPLGEYTEQNGQIECKKCPVGTSTHYKGTYTPLDCVEKCKPGFYSDNGLTVPSTCKSCPRNTYKDKEGTGKCVKCPKGRYTATTGAMMCKARCPSGKFSESGIQPCQLCPKNTYQAPRYRTSCIKCAPGEISNPGSKSRKDCKIKNECLSNACQNKGTCLDKFDAYQCVCSPGFTGVNCEININDCDPNMCQNAATCIDLVNRFSCKCTPGFAGSNCEFNINECASNPCLKNGICIDSINGYLCECPVGFAGKSCEINIDDCVNNRCENGGSCQDLVNGLKCNCAPGFTGETCNQNIDDCTQHHCRNNATCIDSLQSYMCRCPKGFTGKYCEINTNDCASNPCRHGTCLDDIAEYYCACPPYYIGKQCETKTTACFHLDYTMATENDFYELFPRPAIPALTGFTIEMYLQTDDTLRDSNLGTPISYGNPSNPNAFLMTNYKDFKVILNKEEITTGVNVADGKWHHVCFTWTMNRGQWQIHKDGTQANGGETFSSTKTLLSGGYFVIGQRITSSGDYFNLNTFDGRIQGLNLYNKPFLCGQTKSSVTLVKAWPDFLGVMEGKVVKVKRQQCTPTVSSRAMCRYIQALPTSALSASSEWASNHGVANSRLYHMRTPTVTGAWSAKTNDANQWIQVDFGQERSVTSIATQGRDDYPQWVTSYKLLYSSDGSHWNTFTPTGGDKFPGNSNSYTVVNHFWDNRAFNARYVRLQPLTWHGHISMRWEIFGTESQTCSK